MWIYVEAIMPNITLAIDDSTLKSARAYAKRNGTTLNALVRMQLTTILEQEQRMEEARAGLLELIENSTGRLPKGYKFDREKLYESPALSGHKRAGVRSGRKAG
jgi:antitoxin component of RelBE/YafQ-DinJ toxin-antitoxin module